MSPPLAPPQARRVEQHLHLVDQEASRLTRQLGFLDRDELVGIGQEALVNIALRFQPERGIPFGAYARPRIRWAIKDQLRRENPRYRQYKRALQKLDRLDSVAEPETAAAPSAQSLQDTLAHYQDKVRQLAIERYVNHVVDQISAERLSPEAATDDDKHESPEQSLLRRQRADRGKALLNALPSSDQQLVRDLYRGQKTMSELAEQQGVSISTISRRHARIIRDLQRLAHRSAPV